MKHPTFILLAIPIVAALGVWEVWLASPKDISYEARQIGIAYEQRDADALYDKIFEYERGDGLGRGKFRTIYRELVIPRLSEFRMAAPLHISRISDGQANTEQQLSDSNGRIADVELLATLTPDGGRLCLFDILKPAWYASYIRRTGRPISQATFGTAVAEGLKEDSTRLESLGVLRFRTANPDGKGVELDKMRSFYASRVPHLDPSQ